MTEKTLAMRLLEGKKVNYRIFSYPPEERDAERIADLLGLPPAEVFKTLVVLRPAGKPMLVMLPADRQLDLKGLAREVGEKKVKLASHKEAESLTGLQVGGISPLALVNRGFDIYLDESGARQTTIVVSAGQKGLQIQLATADLLKVTRARTVVAAA